MRDSVCTVQGERKFKGPSIAKVKLGIFKPPLKEIECNQSYCPAAHWARSVLQIAP